MRDSHRMKEKFDLSLDNRQIVGLFITSIVVLGAVFVIGVVVGKKLAVAPHPAEAPDLLTALDQKAAQMEEARQDPPLTFQEELTKKSADPVAAPSPAPKPPEKGVVTADVKPAPAKEATPKPVVAKADPTPKPAVAKADAKPPPATEAAGKRLPEKVPVLDGRVAPSPVATRTAEKDDLHTAFARIQQATTPSASGAFAVQVAASQNRVEAEAQVARLKAKGYAPYIVSATVPGKGTWYRVRLGSFSSREDASRYLDDFRRETRLDAFVASTH